MIESEPLIRLLFFLVIFSLVALAEWKFPRKGRQRPRYLRWYANMGIVFLNSFFLKLLFPMTAVAFAEYVASQGWGLFNLFVMPVVIEVVLSVVLLDLIIYGQHVAFHHIPFCWRLHRMHHADVDIDVTTGARFHPLEIILSMGLKFFVIILLGPSALAVLVFEIVLNGCAMFNHGNLRLPLSVDRLLRKFIVTPDFHRVHHSVIPSETNSNFGFNLTLWDRVFGTYIPQPSRGHDEMLIGLEGFRDVGEVHLHQMLTQPFRPQGNDIEYDLES